MKLLVAGLNHRTAPLEVREKLAFPESGLPRALTELRALNGFLEGLILSTCNRVEIVLASDDGADPRSLVDRFLAHTHRVEPAWLGPYLYSFEDREAIHHLFRVAASLDSMVVGEPQILGQLKTAFAAAKECGAVSGFLESVLTRAFAVAKRVRSETDIGKSAVSVSYAAVELAREIFSSLKGKRVLIVGAGKMSELAARHLRRSGCAGIAVTNRTRERAAEMARLFEGTIVEYDRFHAALPEMDIVITSSGAPHYLLTREQVHKVLAARRNRPMFLIDIAVPRNVEPTVNELDNVFLYDIDDLQRVVDQNLRGRLKEAEQAEEIISEEVDRLVSRLRTREVVPTIVTLQEQLEQIRLAEIDRVRGKLGALTPQQEEAVAALTRGIVNKVAHGSIAELRRNAGKPEGELLIDTVRRLFRLGD
ncbi:MAG TPA: glutamyl-tRNA reductase [Solibacterales bacterium]|nr:glutamyl-tRNA reductase [Bryobacterales bacterium]